MELQGDSSKSYFDDNKTCEIKRKLDAIEMATEKLMKHFFELELLEIMDREIKNKLRQKEKDIDEEKRKLEEMQYQRWAKINDFCDQIWKISANNDIFNLFNKYLDMPKDISCKIDPEKHPEVLKLRREVDDLEKKLANKKSQSLSLEEKMLQMNIQLQIAESYRKKDPEIIRLTKNIERYQKEITIFESKIQALETQKFNKLQPLSKAIFVRNNKNNFLTATELIAQEKMKDVPKRSTFSVKKESAISRKLADARET